MGPCSDFCVSIRHVAPTVSPVLTLPRRAIMGDGQSEGIDAASAEHGGSGGGVVEGQRAGENRPAYCYGCVRVKLKHCMLHACVKLPAALTFIPIPAVSGRLGRKAVGDVCCKVT